MANTLNDYKEKCNTTENGLDLDDMRSCALTWEARKMEHGQKNTSS